MGNKLIEKVLGFFSGRMCARTKRIIFLTSLTAYARNSSDLDDATLNRLNQVFDLCGSVNAMRLPVQLSKVIWKGQPIDFVHVETSKSFSDALLERTPDWLRYQGDFNIKEDIVALFKNRHQLFEA